MKLIKSIRCYDLSCNQYVFVAAYAAPLLMLILCWSGVYFGDNCAFVDYNKNK